MEDIVLTDEMKDAIALLEDREERLVWISGRAGTGKSTFLHYLKTELSKIGISTLEPTDKPIQQQ